MMVSCLEHCAQDTSGHAQREREIDFGVHSVVSVLIERLAANSVALYDGERHSKLPQLFFRPQWQLERAHHAPVIKSTPCT